MYVRHWIQMSRFVFALIVVAAQHALCCFFFFQAEDGIRDLVRSRGLGDVYKRQEFQQTLEEEALLQSIEDNPLCPGCGRRVREDWLLSLIHI
mgnify:CR=1 FL=1